MFRSEDGGDTWQAIENGLPSGFGFPIVRASGDGALYAVPLESDESRIPIHGQFRVYRTRDGGASWQPLTDGLPQEHAYMGVLRRALSVDDQDPCGVYVGTTSGDVYTSADGGDHWQPLPVRFPRILSVDAFVETG